MGVTLPTWPVLEMMLGPTMFSIPQNAKYSTDAIWESLMAQVVPPIAIITLYDWKKCGAYGNEHSSKRELDG